MDESCSTPKNTRNDDAPVNTSILSRFTHDVKSNIKSNSDLSPFCRLLLLGRPARCFCFLFLPVRGTLANGGFACCFVLLSYALQSHRKATEESRVSGTSGLPDLNSLSWFVGTSYHSTCLPKTRKAKFLDASNCLSPLEKKTQNISSRDRFPFNQQKKLYKQNIPLNQHVLNVS